MTGNKYLLQQYIYGGWSIREYINKPIECKDTERWMIDQMISYIDPIPKSRLPGIIRITNHMDNLVFRVRHCTIAGVVSGNNMSSQAILYSNQQLKPLIDKLGNN